MEYHVDGELVPAEEATVSVRDRGFLYGDAAFETLRAYGGDLFAWDAHADRLLRTLETLDVDHGLGRGELRERCRATLSANDLAEASVRLSVTRGVQPGKLTPAPEVDPTVVVQVRKLPRGGVEGSSAWAAPARVRTVGTRRTPDESLPSDARTHNHLNGVLARLELRGTAAEEALLVDARGYLAGGAASNVFFVRDEALHTPSLDADVLPGVARSVVLELAREEDLPVETGDYLPKDVATADEAFLTNTTWEVRPVAAVDGTEVGGGPVTDLLAGLYDRRVERRCYGG